ncbi:MAG: hypothetical protein IPM13_16990 [Phycisphaerales bacterium]|nr:hypothetical protein [Phycisphaerales bacterium]
MLATDGSWTYTLDDTNTTVQALSAGETMTDSFVAVSEDGTASAAVTITITGTNDVPVISGEATGDRDVQEDVDASASGTLTITDDDAGEDSFGADAGAASYGSYVLNADGTWTYTLDDTNATVQALTAGETMTDSFVAVSFDGSASKAVTITITGTNDVPVISGEATGDRSVTEESDLAASGTLTIADVDDGESEFTADADTTTYGSYTLATDGSWTYTLDNANGTVQALSAGETMTDSFVAVSEDGTASATVTITITGTNDVPVISGEATGDRDVQEDVDASASGTLTIADVDDGESEFAADADTTSYGSYTLATDGSWTYTLDDTNTTVQALSAGETMTDSFVAVSEDGTASATVTITITGTGDSAVITGEDTGDRDVQEDVDASASGTLTITDDDAGEDSFVADAGAASYGSYVLNADGTWTYTLDDTNATVQELSAGETMTDSFVAVSFDGSASKAVTITITGTNDVPVITGRRVGTGG